MKAARVNREARTTMPVRTRADALGVLYLMIEGFFESVGKKVPKNTSPILVAGLIGMGASAPEWAIKLITKASESDPRNKLLEMVSRFVESFPVE